jgi:prophage regulatory protein
MDRKQATPTTIEFWRLPRVSQATGLGESTIRKLVRQKRFPPPVRLTPRTTAWRSDKVLQWAAERELLTVAGKVPQPSPWLKEAGKKAAEIKRHAKAISSPKRGRRARQEARHA